ncbi:magnesium chelatase domain-containing protein [Mesobacillus subterraneus]|uniref:magnesium chelatase domain-containing protein n=1 Tax=Mesobacillus subterraneus TaxID=285983 RepID=UPI00273E75C0|nr:magnesium chelatase domain-containing protein [Mesobacillus subterraneus]WLR55482.1 magnesium chelatase domain-containing protein [Mesobacillus subterraneus]
MTAALHTMGFPLVDKKVIINLSPAEQKKNGPLFDLAIVIGILKMVGLYRIQSQWMLVLSVRYLWMGQSILEEMIAAILAARKLWLKRLVLPFDATIPRIEIHDLKLVYVETLLDMMNLLAGQQLLPLLVEMIE